MSKRQIEEMCDLVDWLLIEKLGPPRPTPKWESDADDAIHFLQMGADLTVMTGQDGKILRCTLHDGRFAWKLPRKMGERILTEVPLRLCWSVTNIARLSFGGGLLKGYRYNEGLFGE